MSHVVATTFNPPLVSVVAEDIESAVPSPVVLAAKTPRSSQEGPVFMPTLVSGYASPVRKPAAIVPVHLDSETAVPSLPVSAIFAGKTGLVVGKACVKTTAGDGDYVAPFGLRSSTGRIVTRDFDDADGNRLGTITYHSTNLEMRQCSARITAEDGSVIASVNKPKDANGRRQSLCTYKVIVDGSLYADISLRWARSNWLPELRRVDGGGLRVAWRKSKQDYLYIIALLLLIPTCGLGSFLMLYIASQCSSVHVGIGSLDGTTQYVPSIVEGETTRLCFTSDKPNRSGVGYQDLPDVHKLDLLLLMVMSSTEKYMHADD